jgi:hypothetical protein
MYGASWGLYSQAHLISAVLGFDSLHSYYNLIIKMVSNCNFCKNATYTQTHNSPQEMFNPLKSVCASGGTVDTTALEAVACNGHGGSSPLLRTLKN